jgi:transcriptional regulator of arginine metabolism
MRAKENYLQEIIAILNVEIIRSQEELLRALAARGYVATQPTLSRYMRELKIVRKRDAENMSLYVLPNAESAGDRLMKIEFSGSLAVIRTRPGYAMAVASSIDRNGLREIAGTVAGDDTVLIIPREGYAREQVTNVLTPILKKIK